MMLLEKHFEYPKTSRFKELEHKSILHVTVDNLSDPSTLTPVINEVKKDVNLILYKVDKDLSHILSLLATFHQQLLLGGMDAILISKMGMELLIVKSMNPSKYDRSMFIDLTQYRATVFKLRIMLVVLVVGLPALYYFKRNVA